MNAKKIRPINFRSPRKIIIPPSSTPTEIIIEAEPWNGRLMVTIPEKASFSHLTDKDVEELIDKNLKTS